jgi:uncharacterized repeat protein (TIGR01451 family)
MGVRTVAAVVVVTAMLLAVPVAGAVPLPPTGDPLPGGSTFQGADGDQVAAPSTTDWATLPAGTVEHSPDNNAQDTAFAGGSKENEPGNWDFVNEPGGVSPSQANILDAWSSIDEVGANTFLYLAFARAAGSGTSFLTFELNRDHQLWNNGKARVPCRRDGDVLITFAPQGNNVTVSVQTWKTSTTDPMTGCARTGSLSDNASVTANVDIQGAVNAGDITNSLPGSSGATIPTYQFGETAINLGKVLASALGSTCGAFTSFWMHSRSSDSDTANMQDFVAPHAIDARRCSAAGTKWLDNNANGIRDPGDGPLAGFRIYADLNDNHRYDSGEPFAITDHSGDYVIDDIKASGTYTLREEPTSAVPLTGPWHCSHPSPCSYTIDAAAEPYATARDFGNWRPASLILRKQLVPSDDEGRFNLSAVRPGGTPHTVEGAKDGTSETFSVKPGDYTVTETPVPPANAADYVSTVVCSATTARGSFLRGATSDSVEVLGGQRVVCTFINARVGEPAITIKKVAPQFAMHGDTLHYELTVTNTGSVPFPAAEVHVTDAQCDPPGPERHSTGGDTTPESLDPGDAWIYTCQRKTKPVDPDTCETVVAHNQASVTAPDASDDDTANTTLLCPPPRVPGIAIQKVGPATAEAGSTLSYVFYVTNTGEVPFPEANVTVTDAACDSPPQRVQSFLRSGRLDSSSPDVLNPGDVWIYVCTNTTPAPGPDCRPSVVTNTGTVVATGGRPTVDDDDSFDTQLTCPPPGPTPPGPTPPPAPQPQPEPPAPTPQETQNLVPPTAGVAGASALSPIRGCLRRGSRVVIRGSRIASITVTVRGRRVGGLRVTPLQTRAIIRLVGNFTPGRHRATATIRFEPGAGTPTVRLTRTVEVCAAAARPPRFTG